MAIRPSIIFALIGAQMTSVIPVAALTKILGIFLISLSIFSLFKPKLSIYSNWPTSLLGGAISGFLAGLIGVGGGSD